MFNQTIVVGNLGGEPEMRYTPSGKAVTNFSLAVNRSWTGADGQREDKTTWFRVAAWDKQAESCNQYLYKGARVLVLGEILEPNIWTDQQGNARASLELRAIQVKFLSTRAERDEHDRSGGGGGQQQYQQQAANQQAALQQQYSEKDIPF